MKLGVYVVTDRGLTRGRPLKWVIEKALTGGARVVQLREKDIPTKEFIDIAAEIRDIVLSFDGTFIINDRVDIVQAVGACGVHLGQDDMPISLCRKILGDDVIIGGSVSTVKQAQRAVKDGATYLGVSAIFSTPTKPDAIPIGLKGLKEIREAVDIPLVAIGGINTFNTREIIKAGANGIAVVSEVMSAEDPCKAIKKLIKQVKSV